jgi:RNA polymerase sigma factor (sigma-70 family)
MLSSAEQIADEILVLDAQDGNAEAFDKLVRRWQKRLWRHALHLTGRSDTAWEITQESWLDIVRGLSRLNDPARFGAWAYRIVSHKAYDWRHRHAHEFSCDTEPERRPAVTGRRGGDQTGGDVHEILRLLPSPDRVILNLYYLEGFSVRETAAILHMPEGTVKSRLHAARIEFRKIWKEISGAPEATPEPRKEQQYE